VNAWDRCVGVNSEGVPVHYLRVYSQENNLGEVVSSVLVILTCVNTTPGFVLSKKRVKASHTRYRALGPELIPVYRQSACR